MTYDLAQQALSSPLIAAHRGVFGGNIPCNTIAAFEAALHQGADIIELDIAQSLDGQLLVFHPGMEKAHLGSERSLSVMTAAEIQSLRYRNIDDVPTELGVDTLERVLAYLKGRCYINLDKFWTCPVGIIDAIQQHKMQDQCLVKIRSDEALLNLLETMAPDLPLMLILSNEDTISASMRHRKLRYVGAEVLFAEDSAPVASEDYLARMREWGLITWANAIVYDCRVVLSGGHNDDISVTGREQEGWEWLLCKGYNIIQTDWPLALSHYMQQQGYRK